jgi:hypothetical protein
MSGSNNSKSEVKLQGGCFWMGLDENDDEKPRHPVTVSDFAILQTPVTRGPFRQLFCCRLACIGNRVRSVCRSRLRTGAHGRVLSFEAAYLDSRVLSPCAVSRTLRVSPLVESLASKTQSSRATP